MTLPAHEWRERSACKPTADGDLTDVFFPTVGETAGRLYAWDPARMICAGCPVYSDCLAFVRAHPQPEGLWAGMTPEERRRDLSRLRARRASHVARRAVQAPLFAPDASTDSALDSMVSTR